jgi:hypothetical protein
VQFTVLEKEICTKRKVLFPVSFRKILSLAPA